MITVQVYLPGARLTDGWTVDNFGSTGARINSALSGVTLMSLVQSSERILPVIVRDKIFVGGHFVTSTATGLITVVSPVTEEPLGSVPNATEVDVDLAVAAARKAFDEGPWPRQTAAQRADVMSALARSVEARHQEFAHLISSENGCAVAFTVPEVLGAVGFLDYMANLIRGYNFHEIRAGLSGYRVHVTQEPVGVVAAIVPWNAPLLLAMLKVAPALATGCAVVLKPAPETALDSYLLAECLMEAGVPAGVVNIVAADREVSEYLVTHRGVDKVAFTGSTAAGRRIAARCGELLRPVTLELGGKSAAIICDDADLATTLPGLVGVSTMMNGQACALQSRILVSRSRYSEVVESLAQAFESLPIGDPLDPTTVVGPLVAQRQRDRVESYIAAGTAEGAKIMTGGGRPAGIERGWFVEPTLFANVDNGMKIAREEIFGPVVCVIPYEDIDDAIRIANDSDYGLSGSVWTTDEDQALKIAGRIRSGGVTLNGMMFELNCPMGGRKASGMGREMGPEGLQAYLEYEAVFLPGT